MTNRCVTARGDANNLNAPKSSVPTKGSKTLSYSRRFHCLTCFQLQGPAAIVPAGPLASPYTNGCSALPQWVVNGVGACSTPAAVPLSANSNMPYPGFLVAGFNGFCTEDQLKEILGRCDPRSYAAWWHVKFCECGLGCVLG